MMRQLLVQPVADEPADGDVDRRLAHQLAVMDDADQQAGKHQSHGNLAIDPHQHVIIWNELSERASDEEIQLVPLLASKHIAAPPPIANRRPEANPTAQTFSTTPGSTSCATCWRMPAGKAGASSPPSSAPPSCRTTPRPRASNGGRSPINCARRCPSLPR